MASYVNPWVTRSAALPPDVRNNVLASVGALGNSSSCIALGANNNLHLQNANTMIAGSGMKHDPAAMTQDIHRIVRNQYASLFVASSFGDIACAQSGIANAFASVETGIDSALNSVVTNLHKKFKPVSKHIGGTLYNLNNVLKDPIGHGLVPAANYAMSKISPTFAQSHQAAWAHKRLEEIANLPGAIYGSLRHMQSAMTGGQLFGPVQLVKDIYLGALAVVRAVGKLISDTFQKIQKFIFSIFDELLGNNLNQILDIISTVSSYLSIIGAVAGAFSGLGQIANITGQLNGMLGTFSSVLSNPLGVAMRFLPPQIGKGLYYLNNPEAFLATLPPPWSTIICILNAISGQGYSGNLGYALYTLLGAQRAGVLANILGAFNCLTQMLGNVITPTTQRVPPTYPDKLTGVYMPGRPGYLLDKNGNVTRNPCTAPKSPYGIDDTKSSASAPSTETALRESMSKQGIQGTVSDSSGIYAGNAAIARIGTGTNIAANMFDTGITTDIYGQPAITFQNVVASSDNTTAPNLQPSITPPSPAAASYPIATPIKLDPSTQNLNNPQPIIAP